MGFLFCLFLKKSHVQNLKLSALTWTKITQKPVWIVPRAKWNKSWRIWCCIIWLMLQNFSKFVSSEKSEQFWQLLLYWITVTNRGIGLQNIWKRDKHSPNEKDVSFYLTEHHCFFSCIQVHKKKKKDPVIWGKIPEMLFSKSLSFHLLLFIHRSIWWLYCPQKL